MVLYHNIKIVTLWDSSRLVEPAIQNLNVTEVCQYSKPCSNNWPGIIRLKKSFLPCS